MLSQSPHQHITRRTGRVQHITEVPAPALRQEVTVHLHQTLTGAVLRQAAAVVVEVTVLVAVAEAVAHILLVVQAEVHIPEVVPVVPEVVRVLQEAVVHLHLVAGNF